MSKVKRLYVYQTRDKYALPLFVTEYVEELARVSGVSSKWILTSIYKSKRDSVKYPAFDVVIIDESEAENE